MSIPLREIMTKNPVVLSGNATIKEAAQAMRNSNIGDVLIEDKDKGWCLVTDRDIALRAVAEGMDINVTPINMICTSNLFTLSPKDTADRAVRAMRERKIRRIPIMENNRPVGVISIGDLAMQLDEKSALAEISSASANN